MMHTHLRNERAVPWWAVIGAPLVGVPAVVAILALVAPQTQEQVPTAGEPHEVEFAAERAGVESAGVMIEPQAVRILSNLTFC